MPQEIIEKILNESDDSHIGLQNVIGRIKNLLWRAVWRGAPLRRVRDESGAAAAKNRNGKKERRRQNMYNVMIVDDELWFRSYLKELIDQSGNEFLVCAQAANGAEALKILAAQPVDVVIADVLMPVMDGVELMQHLSDLPHRLPVLALSNCDDYLHVRQMLQLGAQDYLLKHEISAAALREHLQRAADWIRQQATVSSEHARERDAEAYVRKKPHGSEK